MHLKKEIQLKKIIQRLSHPRYIELFHNYTVKNIGRLSQTFTAVRHPKSLLSIATHVNEKISNHDLLVQIADEPSEIGKCCHCRLLPTAVCCVKAVCSQNQGRGFT